MTKSINKDFRRGPDHLYLFTAERIGSLGNNSPEGHRAVTAGAAALVKRGVKALHVPDEKVLVQG